MCGRWARALGVAVALIACRRDASVANGDPGTSPTSVPEVEALAPREELERDLAAGTTKIYQSTGIRAPSTWAAAVDPQSGLPYQLLGCVATQQHDDYNALVRAHVAKHGPPKNALKHLFISHADALKLVLEGTPIADGEKITATDGRFAVRKGDLLSLHRANAKKPSYQLHEVHEQSVRVAWGKGDLVVVSRADDAVPGAIAHVDLQRGLVLQRW